MTRQEREKRKRKRAKRNNRKPRVCKNREMIIDNGFRVNLWNCIEAKYVPARAREDEKEEG